LCERLVAVSWSDFNEDDSIGVLLLVALPVVSQDQNSLHETSTRDALAAAPVTAEIGRRGQASSGGEERRDAGPGPRTSQLQSRISIWGSVREKSPVGARYFQLAVLIIAREIDQQYEWSAHEPAAATGLEQRLSMSSSTTAMCGTLRQRRDTDHFRAHAVSSAPVSSELWERCEPIRHQRTVQLMMIMGDYFRVGFMLNAVDQHCRAGEALLPPSNK